MQVSLCEECNGLRYNREALEVTYQNLSLGDILRLTILEASTLFSSHKKIKRALDYAVEYLIYLEILLTQGHFFY